MLYNLTAIVKHALKRQPDNRLKCPNIWWKTLQRDITHALVTIEEYQRQDQIEKTETRSWSADPDSDNDLGCLGQVSSCMQRQEAWEAAVEGGRVGGGGGGRDRACSNRTLPPGGGCSPAWQPEWDGQTQHDRPSGSLCTANLLRQSTILITTTDRLHQPKPGR